MDNFGTILRIVVGALLALGAWVKPGPLQHWPQVADSALLVVAGAFLISGLSRLLQPIVSLAAPFLRTVNSWIHKLMLWVADAALIAMVCIVSLAVTLRYVFNTGIGWAEEVPRLLVTLFAFLAMAMGVRDHVHIGVDIIFNLFPKDGKVRRFMIFMGDYIVLLCGLFMLYYGTVRCLQMMKLPGRLPMTNLNTWWQYLPIPLAGFVISFDSLLFLFGALKREDILYSEPEVDYVEEYENQQHAEMEVQA